MQPVGHRHRERGVVDVRVELVHLDGVAERLVETSDERGVRVEDCGRLRRFVRSGASFPSRLTCRTRLPLPEESLFIARS